MKLELISLKTCPYVQRSVILMKEKGIPYTVTYIDTSNPLDWFQALSPLGKVPVLRVDNEVLFESSVINEFLDETHPPTLHPADPLHRARNRAWIEINGQLNAAQFSMVRAKTPEEFATKRETAHDLYTLIDTQLSEKPSTGEWFNGETFSLVDATYAPSLMRLNLLETWLNEDFLKNLPAVRNWAKHLAARPSVMVSVVPEFAELYRQSILKGGGMISDRL